MGSHVRIAGPTDFAVAGGARWHTLAPHTAGPTRPVAHIWPRV